MNAVSLARLGEVHPLLSSKIQQLDSILSAEEIEIQVIQGLRSWQTQATLYAQGRTAPGSIVTNAPPGYSWHQFGLAVDCCPATAFDPNGAFIPDWNASHPTWKSMIAKGEALGLYSGSQFCHLKDMPHFQLVGRFAVSPDSEVRQLFKDGGMAAVWEESGLATS